MNCTCSSRGAFPVYGSGHHPHCGLGQSPDARLALERARVVGVLDARAADRSKGLPFELRPNTMVPLPPDKAWYVFQPHTTHCFYGATPDAARAAAAKAIESGEV